MTLPEAPPLDDRRAGFLVGAAVGSALAARTAALADPTAIRAALAGGVVPLAPPPGRRRAAVALADGLLEELLGGGVDLHRLARGWVTWWQADGLDADAGLREALAHLAVYDAPAERLEAGGASALAATLPSALAAGSPRAMVAGAFHTARLVDPTPEGGLAAVAVVVAAARFLEGHRDFLADVLGVLRANDAPPALFGRVQDIARDPRRQPPPPRGPEAGAVTVATWALWQAHHRPRGVEALEAMVHAGGVAPEAGAVLGALLGARDGTAGWPAKWLAASGEDVVLRVAVARRLAA
jgi:hypothetical protein